MENNSTTIHPSAEVSPLAQIGSGTRVWHLEFPINDYQSMCNKAIIIKILMLFMSSEFEHLGVTR